MRPGAGVADIGAERKRGKEIFSRLIIPVIPQHSFSSFVEPGVTWNNENCPETPSKSSTSTLALGMCNVSKGISEVHRFDLVENSLVKLALPSVQIIESYAYLPTYMRKLFRIQI